MTTNGVYVFLMVITWLMLGSVIVKMVIEW